MDWMDLGKKIAGSGAKLLGSVVAGPVGGDLGGLVARALGAEDESPGAIARAIDRDPQAGARLLELEHRHAERLEELEFERTRLRLADVQSARQRNVQVIQATGKGEGFIYVLAVSIIALFGLTLGTLIFVPLPEGASSVLYVMVGTLGGAFGAVVQFFFGSSKGSSQKTEALRAELDKRAAEMQLEREKKAA